MLRGDGFLLMLRNFRIAWLGGRFGGGKTALSVRLGYEFVQRGWSQHIVTNFPCVLASDIQDLEVRDCFVVLDEAGVWLRDSDFDAMTAFLRKRNIVVVLASVLPVSLRAKTLNIQRTFNGHTLGVNVWQYSCQLDYMRVKERMGLTWVNPSEVFGLYDTTYVADDDAGIVGWLKNAFKKQDNTSVPDGAGDETLDSMRRLAWAIDESAQKLADSVSVPVKRRGRGGR